MNNWRYHDSKMIELKKTYNKIDKQKQLELQTIFNTFNFSFKELYNIASKKTKDMIDIKISEWRDKGLLKGYFGTMVNNIYKRTRVKNNEILELLIYGAYIEEQSKLEETELNTFKDVANYYYQQGQDEINQILPKKKRRKTSAIPDAIFLALLATPNAKGYIWDEYIEAIIKYNADQIYRQATIDLQQQKELDITNDIYQNLIKRQNNSKLNINGDKISGDVDLTLIGINNQAKLEGIYSFEDKAKVKFVSVMDENTTKMCASLNGQEFSVHDWNEFKRYSKTNDSLVKYRCYGLIVGLNCPPINDGFHWCRSYIIYLPSVEKEDKTDYNIDIPKINKEIKSLLKDTTLNKKTKKLFNKYLTSENIEIDNNMSNVMCYNTGKDKILVNPEHPDFKYYDLQESFTHEIIHMIDYRNNISKSLNINNELSRAKFVIDTDEDKYIEMFKSSKYEDNMTLGDIFSAITNGKITGNVAHDTDYWNKDERLVNMELSANIMSAYLTNNKDTLEIINSINVLKEIKEKVVKKYNDYTR